MRDDNNSRHKHKPSTDTNSQPMPKEYSNTANHKGATDLGTEGTKATASQQQGQGAWASKDNVNNGNRNGSRKSGGGQGGPSKTGQ